ncbi:PEP-CTERM sorting domain-containing protein [Aeoliella sp.]|uniref:PEP-CTERM sorting domain-containing protein n=1 Tax=Aeoliella sp. TaxID=2795800 RepID=UPI003CCBAA4D
MRGTFRDSSRNGPGDGSGMWDVYGLNDVTTTGQGNNWIESGEGSINYSNASGVDNSALIDTFAFNSDATFLGTMSFDGNDVQPLPFASNSTDLPLGSFLNADTDGLVTFMFMSSSQDGHEYHIDSKEGNMSGGHGPMTLNFVVPDGDVDGINGVDLVDLQIIADNFRQSVTSRIQGDLTNDNFVDFDDFDQWKRNYNGSLANLNLDFLTGTQVPEPTSAVLAALAIGGASIAVRCRRAKVRSLASRS